MMSNQIRVLYTEHKTKKVKVWLDGYLVPCLTLNSARLISAGKHEIDVVFYSSMDDIKPGREFETDRYLISVEEPLDNNQPCPRPSYAVNDPTMKNRPKSAGFVPPRLVPRSDPPPPPPPIATFEHHNPNQWGYAGMTTAMKRSAYEDENETNSTNLPKIPKSSSFIPPTFRQPEPIPVEEPPPSRPNPPAEQPGLLNDTLISRIFNKPCPQPVKTSPVKQAPQISWSTWDDRQSDDEDSHPPPIVPIENLEKPLSTKQATFSWQSLAQSVGRPRATEAPKKTSETMPKFDFDDSAFDTLFDNADD